MKETAVKVILIVSFLAVFLIGYEVGQSSIIERCAQFIQ